MLMGLLCEDIVVVARTKYQLFMLRRVPLNWVRLARWKSTVNAVHAEDLIEPIHPLLLARAQAMTKEYNALEKKMEGGAFDLETTIRYLLVLAVLENYHRYNVDMENVKALLDIINEESPDQELMEEAQNELKDIVPNVLRASQNLQKKLLPALSYDDKPAMMELRPGVGGSEAGLFAEDLLNMYINYANHKRWPLKIMSKTVGSNNGLTEAIITFDFPGAYNTLRHESGVHRVQRVPATETKGRTHTSTAAVVVLPKMSEGNEQSLQEDERQFAPGEVRIDTMRAGGKGGQHVNTTDSAVRLVHIPTGIIVMQQDERSQPRNKAKAFQILRSRLALIEREKEVAEQRKMRTDQVTTTDRSDKIRTYNYPQNRVTDHRCGHSVHDLPGVMAGVKLDELIEKVDEHEFEERLQLLIDLEA